MFVKIDSSGLTALVGAARQFSGRAPAVAVATALYEVGMKAYKRTPFATPERIASDLSTEVSIAVGPRGGKSKKYTPTDALTYDHLKPIPLAVLIVIARMRPGSRYNALTGGRYQISDMMGFSEKQLGAYRLKAYLAEHNSRIKSQAVRMIKQRNSSTHFLQSCWVFGLRELVATGFVSKSSFRGSVSNAMRSKKAAVNGGWAILRLTGSTADGELANDAGGQGDNAVMKQRHNRALWDYAAPAAQAAVAEESGKTAGYIRDQMAKHFGPLQAHGITIDV